MSRDTEDPIQHAGIRNRPLSLSPKQRTVAELTRAGKTCREIAHDLHENLRTIEQIRARIMKRLDVHRASDMVRELERIGFL